MGAEFRTFVCWRVLQQIGGHGTNLQTEARDIVREGSKRVFIVIRGQECPRYGHQTLR